EDSCSAGGTGWVMELMAASGSRSEKPLIDLNGNGQINTLDKMPLQTETLFPSGFRQPQGTIPAAPAILTLDNLHEYKYIGFSDAQISRVLEDPGSGGLGRQTWRRIQ